jgi:hypothetical protein
MEVTLHLAPLRLLAVVVVLVLMLHRGVQVAALAVVVVLGLLEQAGILAELLVLVIHHQLHRLKEIMVA